MIDRELARRGTQQQQAAQVLRANGVTWKQVKAWAVDRYPPADLPRPVNWLVVDAWAREHGAEVPW